jgi:hypothetical protein
MRGAKRGIFDVLRHGERFAGAGVHRALRAAAQGTLRGRYHLPPRLSSDFTTKNAAARNTTVMTPT